MYEKLGAAAKHIGTYKETPPRVGIILGSGLGAFVDSVEDQIHIPYQDIPHFRDCTVEGHQGRLILGTVSGVDVAILQGRLHAYEGLPMEEVVFPTRVLATLGVEKLILTNAAGGINQDYIPGDIVCISDHINMMAANPLIGPNINELGPRFPDMTQAYNLELQGAFKEAATEMGYNLKSGIYAGVLGPTYETPAEVRMLGIIGADMVGMSTVPESIAANHLGIQVCGLSCITNMAAGISKGKLDHSEVKEQALKVMKTFSDLLSNAIGKFK